MFPSIELEPVGLFVLPFEHAQDRSSEHSRRADHVPID